MSLPYVTLTGNAVGDAALRFTASGLPVVNLRIACSNRVFDKDANEWKDGDTTFIDVSAWRQLAENTAEVVVKGTTVTVTGELKQRQWETDSGEKRTAYEVAAKSIAVDLARHTARVQKAERTQSTGRVTDDPWAGGVTDDVPPF